MAILKNMVASSNFFLESFYFFKFKFLVIIVFEIKS